MVEEASNGQLIIDLKENLFPPTENIYGVMEGRADMTIQWLAYVSGTFPLLDFGSIPFLWQSGYEYEKAINDSRLAKILDDVLAENGLVYLMDIPSQVPPLGGAVWSNEPMSKISDFAGKKIRAHGTWSAGATKLLGATPVTIAGPEITDALARGTVDAVYTSTTYGFALGVHDVSEYANLWNITSLFPNMMVMSQDSYNELPEDLQQVLRHVAKELEPQVFMGVDVMLRYAMLVLESITTVVKPEPAEIERAIELTKPTIDEWLQITGPRGAEIMAIVYEYAGKSK